MNNEIDYLIKENLELKRKLGEADDAVEYWQIECDKRSKVLDKIKPMLEELKNLYDDNYTVSDKIGDILELLEEIE
jgi:hypothetical protein